jgi:diguanylate cyclase (GGDEF)-like protein
VFPRSFRARLTSFFIVIVILPMLTVTFALLKLVANSEEGKTDAGLGSAKKVAVRLAEDRLAESVKDARTIGGSPALARALQNGSRTAIESALKLQLTTTGAIYAKLSTGGKDFETGNASVIAPATTTLVASDGNPGGDLTVARETTTAFANEVKRIAAVDVDITGDRAAAASTLPDPAGDIPRKGEHQLGGRDFRVASFSADGAAGPLLVHLLTNAEGTKSRTSEDRREVILILAAFLIMALAFAFLVSKALQAQVQRLLTAARRLGKGDFAVQVPTEGNDEFAALGTEFNSMARQLESRLDELEAERVRLQHAIRRVGESLATGLDREALLQIVVQTAVDGVAATTGRASARDAPGGPLERLATIGAPDGYASVLDDAEDAVLATRDAAEVSDGDRHAMSHPLWPSDGGSKVIGLVTVARNGRPFSPADQDLFHYLASQAAVSIENADLHETVQRQAVTDELTGLFNHRRFQEVMTIEVERSRRYGHQLGLIMLDIDDFKEVNDRYGHLQGDQVLREVARVLLDTSREIDEPARYGGEEMAVALPQTDLQGAALFAERLRGRIESLEIPVLEGEGVVKITASVGAAALAPPALADKDTLVRAADAALYRAKRLGKNRVVKAG